MSRCTIKKQSDAWQTHGRRMAQYGRRRLMKFMRKVDLLLTAFEASSVVLVVADHDFFRCVHGFLAFRAFCRLRWLEWHLHFLERIKLAIPMKRQYRNLCWLEWHLHFLERIK